MSPREWWLARLLRRMLLDRPRSRRDAARGRITSADLKIILEAARSESARLTAAATPERQSGARAMVASGVASLALYRALRASGIDREDAIELGSDVMYAAYRQQLWLVRLLGRLLARSPLGQMAIMQRMLLWYPLGKGYRPEVVHVDGAVAYDLHRCPVYDYFAGQGDEALEFFRASWCTFDAPLAAHLVDGGRYERPVTLSAGGDVCAMRWFA